jgi:all-trans-retinol 13,14-reductase
MTVGTALHRAKLDSNYDVIVVGSGIGSLTAAACLAKTNQRVLVLEKHYTAGGFTHTYARKGYEWDVGVHYIGDVHRPNSVLRRVFDYITDGKLEWAPMGEVYDRIYLGKDHFDLVAGHKNFRNRMVDYFPNETAAIDRYLELVKQVNRSSSMFYMAKALPGWLSKIMYRKLTGPFLTYASRTTYDILQSLTNNKRLISVLTGQWGDYGLPPKESSFAIHAMVAKHYMNGAAYPVGGSASIANSIEPVIQRYGGQIITNAEVKELLIKGNQACGIRLANGTEIRATKVISGTGVRHSFQHLVPHHVANQHHLDQTLTQVKPSISHVAAYCGFKGSSEELGLESTNMWIYKDEHHDKNLQRFLKEPNLDFPVIYISFPSRKDPAWPKNYPGKSTIEIISPLPYAWFQRWQGTKWQKRGDDYKQFKADITDRLLAALYAKHPQLEGKLDYVELSSPLSTAHFSNYPQGEIYGLDHTPERFQQKALRPQTPIKNFFLTGQDIVSCGVGGALSAGVLTSIRILGPLKGYRLIKLMQPQPGSTAQT